MAAVGLKNTVLDDGGGGTNRSFAPSIAGPVSGALTALLGSGAGEGTATRNRGGGGGRSSSYTATKTTSTPGQNLNALLALYDDTYGRSMARIADAYNQASAMYKSNLDSTLGQINAAYNKSRGDVTRDAERALRQAYINSEMNKRDIQQVMSAQGLSGGASESTMASMRNQYGKSRTGIEENRNSNLADLLMTRDNNIANANQMYNTLMAQLAQARAAQENQVDAASAAARLSLAQGNLDALRALNPDSYVGALMSLTSNPDYTSGLQNLIVDQNNYTLNPSEATNQRNMVNTMQSQTGQATNYARYLQQLQDELSSGADPNAVRTSLYRQVQNGNVNRNDLAAMLRQLGLI